MIETSRDFFMVFGALLAILAALVFFVGVVMAFFGKNKQLVLKLIIASIIVFIIGFGTCFTSITL